MTKYEHKYKPNNWLKSHGKPMRRRPFKKRMQLIVDEGHTKFGEKRIIKTAPE